MIKIQVLENFAYQGNIYQKGNVIEMEESLVKRFEKEGLVKNILEVLGVEAPKADLSKYVAIGEHKKVQDELKKALDKIAQLEKELAKREVVATKEKTTTKKSK